MKQEYKNPKRLFHGKRIDVLSIETDSGIREVVAHPGAVVILPLLNSETLLLIRNERDVVGEVLWELPAGTLENEEPLRCAYRELEEETGFRSNKITPLIQFFSTPGFSNEILHAFVAEDLVHVGQNLDTSEKIEVEAIAWETTLSMIRENIIRDAKTIAILLYYAAFRK